jgi:phosphotransferase system enzyme I (PtsP)
VEILKKKEGINNNDEEIVILGETISYGIAQGKAFFYEATNPLLKSNNQPFSIEEEKNKIMNAIEKLRNNIGELLSKNAMILTEESLEILDIYRLIIEDTMFEQELFKFIESGKTAFEATECIAKKLGKKISVDAFWKTRFYDMQYLLKKLRYFINEEQIEEPSEFNITPIILIASYLCPADLLYYYQYKRIVGLVLKDKSHTSHTAIVAKSLRIPTLGNIHLTKNLCKNLMRLLIDANSSTLYIKPAQSTISKFQKKIANIKNKDDDFPVQTITKDNIKIELYINANMKEDLDILKHPCLNGVGLFRTEILLMLPNISTDFHTQVEQYKQIFDEAGKKPVIFRTLDVSNDKDAKAFSNSLPAKHLPEIQKDSLKNVTQYSRHLALATQTKEILFSRHDFLKTQIRALLKARTLSIYPNDDINILIPMISEVVELKAYQRIIENEGKYLMTQNPSIMNQVKIGIMLEIPSITYHIDTISEIVDFVAIGTNDLFQFFFATDREGNNSKSYQDVLSPTFLGFIGKLVDQLHSHSIATHVCGEMTADPLMAMALLSLGARKLSVSRSSVLKIAKMINSLPLNLLSLYMMPFRNGPRELYVPAKNQYKNSVYVQDMLQNFAKKYEVAI